MDVHALHHLPLLLEDFPKNRRPRALRPAPAAAHAGAHGERRLKSRVTYSVVVQRLAPEDITSFILAQLSRGVLT
jgi:hypothetical protein